MARRILALASYPSRAASTRHRLLAYLPYVRARGIECDVVPFLDDGAHARFAQPGHALAKMLVVARAALHRAALLVRAGGYDAVVIQREAALIGPELIEQLLARAHRLPIIYDVDDAVWLPPPTGGSHQPQLARWLRAPGKTSRIMRMAAHVVAGSEHIADFARAQGVRHVTVLPSVVSREQWRPLPVRACGGFVDDTAPLVGWVGTPSTAMELAQAAPALRALRDAGRKFRVRVVGAGEGCLQDMASERVPWTVESEVAEFAGIDIGLAPMASDAWAEGKCGFKQLQYMAVGVPQVSSLVGGARAFLRHGENALCAATADEWRAHIATLLDDQALRRTLSSNGRALVEAELCSELLGPRFADVLASVL